MVRVHQVWQHLVDSLFRKEGDGVDFVRFLSPMGLNHAVFMPFDTFCNKMIVLKPAI